MNITDRIRVKIILRALEEERRSHATQIAILEAELAPYQEQCNHATIPHNAIHKVDGKCPDCGKKFLSPLLVKLLNSKF